MTGIERAYCLALAVEPEMFDDRSAEPAILNAVKQFFHEEVCRIADI